MAIDNGNAICVSSENHILFELTCVCVFDVVHLWRMVSFQHSCDMHEFEEKLQGSNQSNQVQQKNC
jgi:hypothetical protein